MPRPTLLLLSFAAACSVPRVDEQAPAVPAPPVPLPDARHGHRIEAVRGALLAFGGYGDADADDERGQRAAFWLPDGGAAWTRVAPLPLPRAFFGSAATADAVFAIADGVDRFDLRTRTWSTVIAPGAVLGPARLPRSHFATATLGERAFVLGGYPIENSDLLALDLREHTVERLEPPPGFLPGDHFHFLAALRGELHVAGGLDARTFSPRREHHVRRGGRWITLPPPPEGLWAKFGASAVVGDRWHVFGDFGHHVFDAAAGTWSPRAPLPFAIVMPVAVVRGGSIWIVGGGRVGGAPIDLLEYRIAADRWVEPAPRAASPRR
jgi:hypothetical protein